MARPSGLSQSNEAEPSREGIPALISLFTGTSVIKQRKGAGGFNREAHCPLQQFS
jgi:hypothetical protein